MTASERIRAARVRRELLNLAAVVSEVAPVELMTGADRLIAEIEHYLAFWRIYRGEDA